MSDPRDRITRALPLRSVDYGESDLIVTLLTEQHGKQVLFASAGKKSRRRFWGALEPFRLSEIRFREGRDERLGQLIEARVLESYPSVIADLHKLYWASFAMELTVELIRDESAATEVFPTAVRYLAWLDQEDREPWFVEAGTLRFCLVLLGYEGLLPALDRCARTGTPLEQMAQPWFSYLGGGLLSPEVVRPEDQAVSVAREPIELLATLLGGHFPADHDLDTLRGAREIVVAVAQAALDRELKSLKLLRTVWLGSS